MGGAIHLDSTSENNFLNITNCYFSLNYGIMGGAINLNLYGGDIYLSDNIYMNNLGYDFANHIGSGSALKILSIGAFIGPIKSKNNKYINNVSEIKGKEINLILLM